MRLTTKTKPKKLTLSQIWELYRLDTGVETSDFVIKMLDLCYPNKNRDKLDIADKMDKYAEAKMTYDAFHSFIEGMV